MPIDLAQQLRDIHEPAIPGYWPLTVAWWLLFSFVLILIIFSLIWYLRQRHRLKPYRRIRTKARALTKQRKNSELDGLSYASAINLLYKELLLDVEDCRESSTAFGISWQDLLANRFNHDGFISDPGRSLGITRFSNDPFFDNGLVELVEETLLCAKPTKKSSDD